MKTAKDYGQLFGAISRNHNGEARTYGKFVYEILPQVSAADAFVATSSKTQLFGLCGCIWIWFSCFVFRALTNGIRQDENTREFVFHMRTVQSCWITFAEVPFVSNRSFQLWSFPISTAYRPLMLAPADLSLSDARYLPCNHFHINGHLIDSSAVIFLSPKASHDIWMIKMILRSFKSSPLHRNNHVDAITHDK